MKKQYQILKSSKKTSKVVNEYNIIQPNFIKTKMRSTISKTPRQRIKSEMSPSPRKSVVKQHKIHNEDKLKVFIKFRPMLQNTHQRGKSHCVTYINEKQLQIQTSVNKKIYTFDHVFDPSIDSQSVFNVGCSELIEEVIEGVHADKINNNGLVFVYGNTGTGKTHSMGLINEINPDSRGLVPDALHHIFEDNNTIQQVCLSFCEIYKDEIYDLLDFEEEKKLNIRQNQKSKEPYIEDLIMIQVKNYKQASQLINIGLEKRRIAEQKVNNRSSRGHGVITFYFRNHLSNHTGRLCFVDLAGCERIKQSESKGATLNEALFINTSLSALETLLMNISDQNVRSYRSNKLTRLLQPYFEFGKIRLFVTSNYESTQSIQFAKRCKGIKFHEREVRKQNERGLKTPKKMEKGDQKINEKIQNIKKQFKQRQTSYLKCISNLMSIINKIHENISTSVSKQSIHSSFSLPQLFQHLPLQSKVNAKINIFEKKEEDILLDEKDDTLSKISSQLSTNFSHTTDDINSIYQKTQQIMKNSQEVGFAVVRKITQLSQLAEYKNVYKKQWFTSEIKNGLLQNKNDQFEKAIVFLMEQLSKFVNQSQNTQMQSKIAKKLKEYGIVLADESPVPSKGPTTTMTKSSKMLTKGQPQGRKSISKLKTPRKSSSTIKRSDENHGLSSQNMLQKFDDQEQNIQMLFNKSRKRSIIYIDED